MKEYFRREVVLGSFTYSRYAGPRRRFSRRYVVRIWDAAILLLVEIILALAVTTAGCD